MFSSPASSFGVDGLSSVQMSQGGGESWLEVDHISDITADSTPGNKIINICFQYLQAFG